MKAVGYAHSLPISDPQALIDIELPRPVATGRDILVEVKAISVNPVDYKIRLRGNPAEGEYGVLGWDAAGVVSAVGEDVTLFEVGDNVWYAGAINRSGTNAEYHLVDERIVSKMPKSLDFVEAAALPLTSITAWEMLFDRFGVTADTTGSLLVIGGAGGVGSIMIQLAKQLTQLTVIATASRPETEAWVTSLGADHVINHRNPLSEELAHVGIESVDYVAGLTHTGDHLPEIIKIVAPQGKFGVIDDAPVLDVMPFKAKSVSIHWELMFTRSLFETADMIEQHKLLAAVAKMVDEGTIKSTATENYGKINSENLIKAHTLIESAKAKGKIVLAGF